MTRTRMYLRMISRSFLRRISRVLIASLSIIVGATTLSALGIVTYTVPDQLARQLRSYGANLVVSPAASDPVTVSDQDRIATVLEEKGVQVIGHAPYRQDTLLLHQQPLPVLATDLGLATGMRPYWSVEGTLPAQPRQVLLGRDLAVRHGLAAGDTLTVRAQAEDGTDTEAADLEISGVLRTGGTEDAQVVMSLGDLEELLPSGGRIDMIEYSLLAQEPQLSEVAAAIDTAVPAAHAQVVKRITRSESGVLLTLQSLIWIVSLVVGALTLISVSTTMNAMVSERATELALKKALGASNREIVAEFFGESVVLGLAGGLLGALGGMALGGVLTQEVFNLSLEANWWVIPVTMAACAAVSGLGSLLSVRRITTINPAIVLTGE